MAEVEARRRVTKLYAKWPGRPVPTTQVFHDCQASVVEWRDILASHRA